jgi:acyl-CoA thioesterase 8
MHCYFVLAGNADLPIIYQVERIRSGRSFATRTVQARQRGKVIFTTTVSFSRNGAGGTQLVEHTTPMPFVPGPEDDRVAEILMHEKGPIVSRSIHILNSKFKFGIYKNAELTDCFRRFPASPFQENATMDKS